MDLKPFMQQARYAASHGLTLLFIPQKTEVYFIAHLSIGKFTVSNAAIGLKCIRYQSVLVNPQGSL